MNFDLTILGNNSAIPAYDRHPTAQLLNVNEKLYLIDCGEGTQIRFNDLKIKRSKINHIFISHLHGDHFFGLFGLINSYHLLNRDKTLHLYGPANLIIMIEDQLKYSGTTLKYELVFHPIDFNGSNLIMENDDITVETIMMKHRIPCTGFLFKEKPVGRKIIPEKLDEYKIDYSSIEDIKNGKDYKDADGKIIPNSELTNDPLPPRSYAYCSDTAYNEEIIPLIKGVDLLYHESTFEKSLESKAIDTYHSTTVQAATLAKKAEVKQLIIGHFSAKYKELEPLLKEAKMVFKNTTLAEEGITFSVKHSDNNA